MHANTAELKDELDDNNKQTEELEDFLEDYKATGALLEAVVTPSDVIAMILERTGKATAAMAMKLITVLSKELLQMLLKLDARLQRKEIKRRSLPYLKKHFLMLSNNFVRICTW